MRNGNFQIINFYVSRIFVLILPMRNGNSDIEKYALDLACSYPTYEEWKLDMLADILRNKRVLILPMRNGNTITYQFLVSFFPFLSYL